MGTFEINDKKKYFNASNKLEVNTTKCHLFDSILEVIGKNSGYLTLLNIYDFIFPQMVKTFTLRR
ncbi:MAG: hypothetical protein Q8K40_06550 [Ignavibacteria bacterium]|nr:hypothetical protein [Ignavibacteria bacterium]